jgi:hypothetical protein
VGKISAGDERRISADGGDPFSLRGIKIPSNAESIGTGHEDRGFGSEDLNRRGF